MSVPARRRQVAYGRERGLSVRRACTLFSVARSALRYQGRKTVKDAGVIERMQELSAQYPRYGYRRIRIFLGRDGHRMSVGRAYRLWRAAGLQLPRKRPRKRVAAARPRPQAPSGPNQAWSMTLYSTIPRKRAAAQAPHRDERVHQGGAGHRCCKRSHSLAASHRRAVAPCERSWRTELSRVEWAGVRVHGAAVLDRRSRHRHGH